MVQGDFGKAIEELGAAATEQQLREQNFRLRELANSAKRDKDSVARQLRDSTAEADELATELALYRRDFSDRPEWLGEVRDDGQHHGTLVAFFSDAHFGEVVQPGELGGYNAYDLAIAEKRTRMFFERTITVARHYLAGVEYDGIVLPLGGDLVSGDIHDELIETNEQSTLRTVETCLPWLQAGIEMLAEEFGRVHVVSAPGNHGRNSKKPRHKKRSENNADTHVARLLAVTLRDEQAVTFDIPESTDVDFDVYGHVFSMEHGDNLRFNGTSEIGSFGPVKRGNLRKTKKRQEMGRQFRYGLYGHFHQFIPAYTQGFVMNGSLKGYDEYASDGQFAPEPAQQALMVVTPEHGITVTAPVICTKRSEEGW
jgi:hypothetical protein